MEMIPYPDVNEDAISYIDLAELKLAPFIAPSFGPMLTTEPLPMVEGYPDRDGAGDDEC